MGLTRLATWLRLPSRYRAKHFRRREAMRPDYLCVARSLLARLEFDSVADVGCANGFLLEEFRDQGKRIAGIELSPAVVDVLRSDIRAHVSIGDFSQLTGRYDLVCCVEVAEHIPEGRSLDLVESLTGLAERWIYFTAAPPGQGGHGHINCRPHAEWLEMFERQGWAESTELTTGLREDLGVIETAHWLRGNSFILQRLDDATVS